MLHKYDILSINILGGMLVCFHSLLSSQQKVWTITIIHVFSWHVGLSAITHTDFTNPLLVNTGVYAYWNVFFPDLGGCGPSPITGSTDESPLLKGFWSRTEADVSLGAEGRGVRLIQWTPSSALCMGAPLCKPLSPFRSTWLAVVRHSSRSEKCICLMSAQMKTHGLFELMQFT